MPTGEYVHLQISNIWLFLIKKIISESLFSNWKINVWVGVVIMLLAIMLVGEYRQLLLKYFALFY